MQTFIALTPFYIKITLLLHIRLISDNNIEFAIGLKYLLHDLTIDLIYFIKTINNVVI